MRHILLILFLLQILPACKTTVDAESSLAAGRGIASISLPVTGGPGFLKVTQDEYAFIESIHASGNLYRNRDFWGFYGKHPELVKILLGKWFSNMPEDRERIQAIANELGAHSVLFLDLGIATRAEAFRDFAKVRLRANPRITSFDLRQSFADSLPKATVWRGVMLTSSELEVTKRTGIKASGFYAEAGLLNNVLAGQYLNLPVYANIPSIAYEDLSRRLGGQTRTSVFSSYSKWIEVTSAGAWMPLLQGGGPLRSGPGMKFQLFKVEVSELDLIRPIGPLAKLIKDKGSMIFKTTGLDGRHWEKSFGDPDFEMFIQFVKPEEIKDVVTYDNMPPRWGT